MAQKVRLACKRAVDVLGASCGLLMLGPFMLLIALCVRIRLGKPIVFRQRRPGLSGKPFCLYKFRTMVDQRDGSGALLPDSVRLTPFGRFLRRTSLDELPELFNVLRGQMSLVGPRPLLMEYLDRYTDEQARRHDVKPGLTGWAQINGRNAISWENKFTLDVWYVDNWSLWLDTKILLITVGKVLCRDDVTADRHATMPVFTGSAQPASPEKRGED